MGWIHAQNTKGFSPCLAEQIVPRMSPQLKALVCVCEILESISSGESNADRELSYTCSKELLLHLHSWCMHAFAHPRIPPSLPPSLPPTHTPTAREAREIKQLIDIYSAVGNAVCIISLLAAAAVIWKVSEEGREGRVGRRRRRIPDVNTHTPSLLTHSQLARRPMLFSKGGRSVTHGPHR